MHFIPIADNLAQIRSEIARLKAREAALRALPRTIRAALRPGWPIQRGPPPRAAPPQP